MGEKTDDKPLVTKGLVDAWRYELESRREHMAHEDWGRFNEALRVLSVGQNRSTCEGCGRVAGNGRFIVTSHDQLGFGEHWPVWSVIRRLAVFAKSHLDDGYDGHGHEVLRRVQLLAEKMAGETEMCAHIIGGNQHGSEDGSDEAEPKVPSATDLQNIAHQLATQDNAYTVDPIFLVQQRERICGFDPVWGGEITWIYDGEEYPEDDDGRFTAEQHYAEHGEEPEGWTRTGYQDRWVFVQPFFTREAAEAYIKANRHRLTDPRVFVDSAYRNREWQTVVQLLLSYREDVACGERPTGAMASTRGQNGTVAQAVSAHWSALRDQYDRERRAENEQLRSALRHLMYVVCGDRSYTRERFERISGLSEAHELLVRLGEVDNSVASQDDAWLPPASHSDHDPADVERARVALRKPRL